jgi:hypothetical protein
MALVGFGEERAVLRRIVPKPFTDGVYKFLRGLPALGRDPAWLVRAVPGLAN